MSFRMITQEINFELLAFFILSEYFMPAMDCIVSN